MNILALDLGTKCGWATKEESGVWDLKPKTTESAGERYRKFRYHLERRLISPWIVPFDYVVYEEVHSHAGVDAAHVFGGLQAILQCICLENKIEYRGVGVGTIKKHATGKGNAKKDDMICAAALQFKNIDIIDDNHADALWLLDLAIVQSGLTIS